MLHPFIIKVNLHDIHEVGHLSEDQDSVIELFKLWEQSIQELELSRRAEDPVMIANIVVVL